MSDKLEPCPFCGGEAEMLTAESMNGGYLFGIMCNDCRSRGDVYDTEAEAIAAWNTRAELCDRDYERKMDALLCRLTNGKFSKSRAYDLDFMESCINYEFELLYSGEEVAE